MGDFRFLFTAQHYDEVVEFYRDTMSLPVVRSWDDNGRGTILAASGTGQIEIFAGDAATDLSQNHLAWEVDDIDGAHQALTSAGVTCSAPPADQPWGHRNASFVAPQGLAITLFEDRLAQADTTTSGANP